MPRRSLFILACLAACVFLITPVANADDADLGPPPAGDLPGAAALEEWPEAAPAGDALPADEPAPPPESEVAPAMVEGEFELEIETAPTEEDVRELVPVEEAATAPAPGRLEKLCCGQVYDRCGWAVDFCNRRYGRWEFRLEGGVGMIEDPEGLLGVSTGLANQMSWDRLEYDVEFAGRAGFQYAVTPRDRVSLTGTFYGSFENSERQTGVLGYTQTPGGGVLSTPVNTATLTSEVDFYGGELHWWHEMCAWQCVSWELGVGIRMLRLDETATADGWATPFPPLAGLPFVQADVENTFIGGQVGASVRYDADRRWSLFASVKGLFGAMGRDIEVRDRDIFIGGAHTAIDEDSVFAWGIDAEVGIRYRVSRSLLIGVSYNLMFLDNVVHATDALDFTQGATGAVQARQLEDDLLVHAVFAGVTLNL
ncbi:MAG: BBP7 family outer membrane beta-barrel protein [Planctomycetota bacterium]|nr:BBP7 family outer membrane beta-barrel protein [Planctomycetota bacterium]